MKGKEEAWCDEDNNPGNRYTCIIWHAGLHSNSDNTICMPVHQHVSETSKNTPQVHTNAHYYNHFAGRHFLQSVIT